MFTNSWAWSGSAILFDLDGTLVDSGASVFRAWQWVAAELELPFSAFAPYVHGIPAAEVFSLVTPALDDDRKAELTTAMLRRQTTDTLDITAIPGALAALDVLPTKRWAVVTSADQPLAVARLQAAGLPLPRLLITSESTPQGKPDPAPYLLAAERLGVPVEECLVVEDAAAGVSAGLAAGARVLGVLSTTDSLDGVSFEVADLTEVEFAADRYGVTVQASG